MIGIDLLMNNAMKRSSSNGSFNASPTLQHTLSLPDSPATDPSYQPDYRIRQVPIAQSEDGGAAVYSNNNSRQQSRAGSDAAQEPAQEHLYKYASADSDEEEQEVEEEWGVGEEEGEEEEEEEHGDRQHHRGYTTEDILNKKRDILYQFDRLANKGVQVPRRFTMSDSLEEMQSELERMKLDREVDMSVRFQRKMLMACVTGIEMLNGKFDPLDVKLDGWSDTIHEGINDYDDVFEELHMKYRGRAKMAPELKLMFMVGGSGLMFHLTSTMFKSSSVPGLEQVLKQNPALMQQFANATMATMQNAQNAQNAQNNNGAPAQSKAPRQAPSNPLGMLGSLFGMDGSSAAPRQHNPNPNSQMRGPKNVDDILKDLHRDAFTKVDVMSNASEGDSLVSDLNVLAEEQPKKKAPAKRKPKAKLT